MPRRRRYGMAGLVFHVLNRGSRRGPIFETDTVFKDFETILIEMLAREPLPVIEFCVMRNHFHLVVQPKNDWQLPRLMHLLTTKQAMGWRIGNGTVGEGAVYQGRYKAIPVQTEEYFYTLVGYVQRNPVRARLVSRPEEWRWGSLWHRLNGPSPIPLAPWPLPCPDNWLSIVNEPQMAADIHEIRRSVNRGFALGNESWRKELAKQLGMREFRLGPGRPPQL